LSFSPKQSAIFTTPFDLMRNLTLIISLLFLVLFSCKKEKKPYVPVQRCADLTRNIDTLNLYIHGNWKFVEELRISREFGVQYLTPDSEGAHHWTLKISGDTATFFTNNIQDELYRFRIQRELEIANFYTDSTPCLVFYTIPSNQLVSHLPILICKNQLLMQGQYVSSVVGERLYIRE
jgi:hypothetical protein